MGKLTMVLLEVNYPAASRERLPWNFHQNCILTRLLDPSPGPDFSAPFPALKAGSTALLP
jgi:hypothetical protein